MHLEGPRLEEAQAQERAALDRARALIARRRKAAEARERVLPTLTILALVVIGLGLSHIFREKPSTERPYAYEPRCDADDSACLGTQIIDLVQEPCTRALEAQLQYPPDWNDSSWQRRFASPAWYQPPDQLIFYGRQATVRNALGMELTPHYFCVVTRSGAAVKAGIPDLP